MRLNIKKLHLKSKFNQIVFIGVFIVAGSILVLFTHASTPSVSLETESATLTGQALKRSDSLASGGSYVEFSQSSGVNKARPFSASSPWNTITPTNTVWFDTPVLHNFLAVEGATSQRTWWVSASTPSAPTDGFRIWWSSPNDPLWTFNMPDYIAPAFSRNRPAKTFQARAPAGIYADTGADHGLYVADPVTGDYIEVWQANISTSTHTITTTGPGWATGNMITGSGVGEGSQNAGTRAANFSWLAGMITGSDFASGKIDHAIAVALTSYTLYGPGGITAAPGTYLAPATAWDNGGSVGPIKMGSKIGIPSGVVMPTILNSEIPAGSGRRPGKMLWDALQQYGMFVGDYAGGVSPVIYSDSGSITAGSDNDPNGLRPLFASWENWFGNGKSAMDIISPYLRVANYQP